MQRNYSRIAAGVISTAFVFSPALAFAQTATSSAGDIQAQIKALFAQIESLRGQLSTLNTTTTPASIFTPLPSPQTGSGGQPTSSLVPAVPQTQPFQQGCPTISRNLGLGSQGGDVTTLQQQLSQDPTILPPGGITGVFGSSTREAVARLQTRFGIASSTGFFGTVTRSLFARRCGELQSYGSGKPVTAPSLIGYGDGSTRLPIIYSTTTPPSPRYQNLNGSTTPQNLQFLEDGNHGGWHGSVPPWQGQDGSQGQQGQGQSGQPVPPPPPPGQTRVGHLIID